MDNQLGNRIRLLRHNMNWSQSIVAQKLDISIPAFSKIETGVTDTNLSRIAQIAHLFGLTPVQLLSFENNTDDVEMKKLKNLNEMIVKRDGEILALQQQIISLFEELKRSN